MNFLHYISACARTHFSAQIIDYRFKHRFKNNNFELFGGQIIIELYISDKPFIKINQLSSKKRLLAQLFRGSR